MFFCTTEYQEGRDMNSRCFIFWVTRWDCQVKLKFILAYFDRALTEIEEGQARKVTIFRSGMESIPQSVEQLIKADCCQVMREVVVDNEGKIESYLGPENILADFANEYIGGGAADFGNVQEEILFLIFPEFFAAQLLCERMATHEAIAIKGIKQFSCYSGYGDSLEFAGCPPSSS